MTDFDGYEDEMSRYPTEEQAERLLQGAQDVDLRGMELARLLRSLASIGEVPVGEEVASRHIAAAAAEAARSTVPALAAGTASNRRTLTRSRTVSMKLMSSRPAKVLTIAVVMAVGMTGAAFAANGAAPGDFLYGLDQAMEKVSVLDGGAAERAAEALAQASSNLPGALESAADAAEEAGSEEAADALTAAAAAVLAEGGEASQETRTNVAALLVELAAQIGGDGVVGGDIAALARGISGATVPAGDSNIPEETPVGGPPSDVPPVETPADEAPPVDTPPVETPPVDGEPDETPPVDTPPVETTIPVVTPPVPTP